MTAPSPAAVRMRRTRERRRLGQAIVSLELRPKVTADLVGLGWLPVPGCGDKDALTSALIELIERAIEARVTPALSSQGKVSFKSNAARPTRWSTSGGCQPDQQDDLSAIAKAFRRVAGRSLAVACNGGLDRWYTP
jgi:hypothetical protein